MWAFSFSSGYDFPCSVNIFKALVMVFFLDKGILEGRGNCIWFFLFYAFSCLFFVWKVLKINALAFSGITTNWPNSISLKITPAKITATQVIVFSYSADQFRRVFLPVNVFQCQFVCKKDYKTLNGNHLLVSVALAIICSRSVNVI